MSDTRGTDRPDASESVADDDADLLRALLGGDPLVPSQEPPPIPAAAVPPPARSVGSPTIATIDEPRPAAPVPPPSARAAISLGGITARTSRAPSGVHALPVSGCFPIDVWRLRGDDAATDLLIPAPDGTPVFAVASGTIRADDESLEVIDAAGLTFILASVIADADVRAMQEPVEVGRRIGRVRSAPGQRVDGVRLSVIDPDGRAINPFDLLVRAADPIELGGPDAAGEDPETMSFATAPSAPTSASADAYQSWPDSSWP